MEINLINPTPISSSHIQCQSCGWIGPTEDGLIPGMSNLVGCPACSDLSVEEYKGPITLEVPIGLLSDVRAKLATAIVLTDCQDLGAEYVKAQAECIFNVLTHLDEFMVEKGALPPVEEDDAET